MWRRLDRAAGSSPHTPSAVSVVKVSSSAPPYFRPHPNEEHMDMFTVLTQLMKNEDGATAIEYGLIAALIAVAAIAAFNAVGSSLTATFNNVSSKL
jgi:pilus assembly protein Flp/PilA